MTEAIAINIIAVLLVLQLLGLGISVHVDYFISRRHKRIFYFILVLILSHILQNIIEYYLIVGPARPMLRTAVSAYGYCVRPLVVLLFCGLVSSRKTHWIAWVLIGLNTLVNMSAFFSHLCFWIDPNNHYQGGPLSNFTLLVSLLLLVQLLYLTVIRTRQEKRRLIWMPVLCEIGIVASVVLDHKILPDDLPISALSVAMVACTFFYFIWLELQYLKEHERALRADQQMQLMMSQIQPHFLFNTLSTIQSLCRVDPEAAYTTTGKFGAYLRQNIDSLHNDELIPLRKELEHTKTYADIEKIRFPSVSVEYHIEDDGYSLPPLTIQPMVENAIRHGVRGMDHGVVSVTTRRNGDWHEIEIRDNGKGFDPEELKEMEGTHIGLHVVKERVEKLAGGTMRIESSPGEGACMTIGIPVSARGRDRQEEAEQP